MVHPPSRAASECVRVLSVCVDVCSLDALERGQQAATEKLLALDAALAELSSLKVPPHVPGLRCLELSSCSPGSASGRRSLDGDTAGGPIEHPQPPTL